MSLSVRPAGNVERTARARVVPPYTVLAPSVSWRVLTSSSKRTWCVGMVEYGTRGASRRQAAQREAEAARDSHDSHSLVFQRNRAIQRNLRQHREVPHPAPPPPRPAFRFPLPTHPPARPPARQPMHLRSTNASDRALRGWSLEGVRARALKRTSTRPSPIQPRASPLGLSDARTKPSCGCSTVGYVRLVIDTAAGRSAWI